MGRKHEQVRFKESALFRLAKDWTDEGNYPAKTSGNDRIFDLGPVPHLVGSSNPQNPPTWPDPRPRFDQHRQALLRMDPAQKQYRPWPGLTRFLHTRDFRKT